MGEQSDAPEARFVCAICLRAEPKEKKAESSAGATCLTMKWRRDKRAPQACVRTSLGVQRGQGAPQGATCQSMRKRGEERGREEE